MNTEGGNIYSTCSKKVRMTLQTVLELVTSSIATIEEKERGNLEKIRNQLDSIPIGNARKITGEDIVKPLYLQYKKHRGSICAGLREWETSKPDEKEHFLLAITDNYGVSMKIVKTIERALPDVKQEEKASPRENFSVRFKILSLGIMRIFAEYEEDEDLIEEYKVRITKLRRKIGNSTSETQSAMGSLAEGLQQTGISGILQNLMANEGMREVMGQVAGNTNDPQKMLSVLAENVDTITNAAKDSLPEDVDTSAIEKEAKKIRDAVSQARK